MNTVTTIKYKESQEVYWLSSNGFTKGIVKTIRFNSDKHRTETKYFLLSNTSHEGYMGDEVPEELIFTSYQSMLEYYSKQFTEVLHVSEPVKEDDFIWDDDLVREFAYTFIEQKENQVAGESMMKKFKQSKQSPPLSEIKEGKGWEVLTVKNKDTGVVDKINLLGTSDNYIRGISTCWDIESVKRLSDNVVFSVGNEVGYDDGNTRTKKCWKIDNFFIRESDNVMLARSYDNINVEVVDKWLFKNNPPSPTTPAKAIVEDKPETVSSNNDDVACLSLNDLKNEWFGKDEERQYGGSWDGIPMYRRFKSIVKEKLK